MSQLSTRGFYATQYGCSPCVALIWFQQYRGSRTQFRSLDNVNGTKKKKLKNSHSLGQHIPRRHLWILPWPKCPFVVAGRWCDLTNHLRDDVLWLRLLLRANRFHLNSLYTFLLNFPLKYTKHIYSRGFSVYLMRQSNGNVRRWTFCVCSTKFSANM